MPSLQFKGKALVQNHHLVVPFCELEPVKSKGLSKSPSLHDNLIIEGDNLRALKALLPTYHGKVKCIYIDPPYNTGNEGWVYNDKVNSPMIRDWLGKTVDRDDLTRHDKWCCMMLPRLKLLRELLSDDGAIFVSIDDNEVHHLRTLMDEVFGEENFVTTFIWRKVDSPNDNKVALTPDHEFIAVYARSVDSLKLLPKGAPSILTAYGQVAEDGRKYRDRLLKKNGRNSLRKDRPTMYFPLRDPDGNDIYPTHDDGQEACWAAGIKTIRKHQSAGTLIWKRRTRLNKEVWEPYTREFAPNVPVRPHPTIWNDKDTMRQAKARLRDIFDTNDLFLTPKPSSLIESIFELIDTGSEFIVLDSFAGSGSTAEAVLTLNRADDGNRRFILCQMPHETKEQEARSENIADSITAERVRRVIQGIPAAKDEALRDGLGGSFSYFRLGRELRKQAILDGKNLPSYESLAGYIFFTATGEEFQPDRMQRAEWFIGESREYDVFLIYEQEVEKLKNLALNLELARKLPSISGKKKLVFAPTKYLDQEFLDRLKIKFCQLPFEIYQNAERA